jgi:hypothetical protein
MGFYLFIRAAFDIRNECAHLYENEFSLWVIDGHCVMSVSFPLYLRPKANNVPSKRGCYISLNFSAY